MALKAEAKEKAPSKHTYQRQNEAESSSAAASRNKSILGGNQFQSKTTYQQPEGRSGASTGAKQAIPSQNQSQNCPTQGSRGNNSNNPYTCPTGSKCFRCNKPGYHSNECPE